MNRKKFIKNVFLTGVIGAVASQILGAKQTEPLNSSNDSLQQTVAYRTVRFTQ